MDTLLQDIRFGARMLWKHRGATLVAVLALALGIGVNTAMFSTAEAFLLHPVPFEDVDRLAAIYDARPQQNVDMNEIAPATYFDWQEQARSFEKLAAYEWNEVNLTGGDQPQKVQGFRVTAGFFDLLRVRPLLGRTFHPEEEQPGKGQEIVLGYGLWQRRYASDPNVIGKTVKVNGLPFTIVGVMNKGFDFPLPAEAWMPLALDAKERLRRDSRDLWVFARLKPRVSLAGAQAEMNTIAERLANGYPDTNRGWQVRVVPLGEFAVGNLTRQYTLLLMGAVGFVLLIACSNVANIQFARATGRAKELAVRTALGAGRLRIIRQLLTESVLLSLLGASLGLFFAAWDVDLIRSNMPPDVAKFIAGWTTIRLDANAFLFTLAVAVASGVLSGLAPALFSSRADVNEALKESGRGASSGRSRHRLRSTLVVVEMSLAVVLLVGAGLLVKGFRALLDVHDSYSPQTLLTFNVSLPEAQYQQPASRLAFCEQALQRLSSTPQVQSAAIATYMPYSNGGGASLTNFSIEGRPVTQAGELQAAIPETVSPEYFRMMNIALRDGRLLTDSDTQGALSVAVISESLARRFFSSENPLGRRVKVGAPDSNRPWMTIVGVVRDLRYSWINKDDVPALYRPFRQAPPYYATFALRAPGDPLRLVSAVRAEIAAVDPELPLFNIKPMDRLITESVVGIAYVAAMMAVLGIIAVILAAVGIYGVMAYAVGERTHEFGVRMALGAQARDILAMVLRNGALLTGLGFGIGLPIAFLLAQALAGLLFGVRAADTTAFLVLPLVLAAVAFLACYIPGRRATRVDPVKALRWE